MQQTEKRRPALTAGPQRRRDTGVDCDSAAAGAGGGIDSRRPLAVQDQSAHRPRPRAVPPCPKMPERRGNPSSRNLRPPVSRSSHGAAAGEEPTDPVETQAERAAGGDVPAGKGASDVHCHPGAAGRSVRPGDPVRRYQPAGHPGQPGGGIIYFADNLQDRAQCQR